MAREVAVVVKEAASGEAEQEREETDRYLFKLHS